MISVHSPFGCPSYFFECDTEKKIRLLLDPNPTYFQRQIFEDRKRYDKLLIVQGLEPRELNDISNEIILNKNQFDYILSSFPEVINSCENSELFLYAACWILTDEHKNRIKFKKEYHNIFNTNKKFKLSHVMSHKNFLPGHKLRHTLKPYINSSHDFELMFPDSIPMEHKYKLFEDSMFHIAIENTKNVNYISEKIIDCFMSYTIPIYWGSPNISDYFNTEGIIIFETEEDFRKILNELKPSDYFNRMEAMKENYQIAYEKFAFHADRVNDILHKIVNEE